MPQRRHTRPRGECGPWPGIGSVGWASTATDRLTMTMAQWFGSAPAAVTGRLRTCRSAGPHRRLDSRRPHGLRDKGVWPAQANPTSSAVVVEDAVVHAERVTDPAHRVVRRERAIVSQAPDVVDQAQQLIPAVPGWGWVRCPWAGLPPGQGPGRSGFLRVRARPDSVGDISHHTALDLRV
jgi:hypothetical protein